MSRSSRRDVPFAQLIEDPARYRGLPIHIEGTLLRVIRQDVSGSQIFPKGVYYEGYVVTPDSGGYLWVLAFEVLPEGIPVGTNLNQQVSFDGYFLKVWRYLGGVPNDRLGVPQPKQSINIAPLLIGRFPPAAPAGTAPAPSRSPFGPVAFVLLGGLGLYLAIRVATQMRRLRRREPITIRRRPIVVDTIEPEQLSAWVEGQQGHPSEGPARPNGGLPSGLEPGGTSEPDGPRGA